MVQNVARITLEADGYFVLTAHNGKEALHLSRKFPGTIHAVLSDVRMPKMDGLELRERLLRNVPGFRSYSCPETLVRRAVMFRSSPSRSVQPSC